MISAQLDPTAVAKEVVARIAISGHAELLSPPAGRPASGVIMRGVPYDRWDAIEELKEFLPITVKYRKLGSSMSYALKEEADVADVSVDWHGLYREMRVAEARV